MSELHEAIKAVEELNDWFFKWNQNSVFQDQEPIELHLETNGTEFVVKLGSWLLFSSVDDDREWEESGDKPVNNILGHLTIKLVQQIRSVGDRICQTIGSTEVLRKLDKVIDHGTRKKPVCHVRIFESEFAKLIKSGEKCHTVRKIPKKMPNAGETLSLREWEGRPYRSKQREIASVEIHRVAMIDITEEHIFINGMDVDQEKFARADGFSDFQQMKQWIESSYSLPFEGIVIFWENDTETDEQPEAN